MDQADERSEETKQRERKIYQVTLGGSAVNFLLLVVKFVAGFWGGSAAMIADAVHSLSDFVTDIIVLLFVRISGKPCDADHGYGHGKYETLATTFIGSMLFAVGLGILWSGVTKIHSVIMGNILEEPGMVALVAALFSIVAKELMYQWTVRVGKVTNSPAVVANAWHHRSDAFSSIGTAVGIGGAIMLGQTWRILDPIAAVVVSIFILRVSYQLVMPSIQELLERSLPEEDNRFIIDTILSEPGISSPHNLRTRSLGSTCVIDVHFRMHPDTPLYMAHEATRHIEDKLRQRFGNQCIITTHVEPIPAKELERKSEEEGLQ